MWKRHLLFWSVVMATLAALAAHLTPQPSRFVVARAEHAPTDVSWRPTVARLDALLAAQWRSADIPLTAEADSLLLARRLALALLGTVPSLEEIRFLQQAPQAAQLDRWLEYVLDDPRHHEYWAERLARALVGVKEGAFLVYRRRRFVSWLSDQVAADRSYAEIASELITADGLWTDQPATNFVTVTIKPGQDNGQPQPHELAARVCRSMLGVRIDCAECHDHPFDRWKQRDFQGLAAFFSGTSISARGIRDQRKPFEVENFKTGQKEIIAPAVPFDEHRLRAEPSTGSDDPRSRLAAWVTSPDNRHFSRAIVNRVWALMFGRGLVAPIDDLRDDTPLPAALDLLADDFVEHGFRLRRLIRVIAHSAAFRRASQVAEALDSPAALEQRLATWAVFPLTRLRSEQVALSVIQAASLTTLDHQSHLVFRLGRYFGTAEFIKRYGDAGEDELLDVEGTIPQRLLMMNGKLVSEKTQQSPLLNAVTQIGQLCPGNAQAVELIYLTVLSRLPTAAEQAYFVESLETQRGQQRLQRLEDLSWALLNSTEFAWNH